MFNAKKMRSKHELLDTCTYAANYKYIGAHDIKPHIVAEEHGTQSPIVCKRADSQIEIETVNENKFFFCGFSFHSVPDATTKIIYFHNSLREIGYFVVVVSSDFCFFFFHFSP